jgi:nitroreductase
MFLEGGGLAYQHGCAAAIQNMLLAAHALGLGTLWFTLFEKDSIRKTLKIDQAKEPLALICLGKPATAPPPTPRKAVKEITSFVS